MNRRIKNGTARVFKRIDDPGMAAAGNHYQPLRSVDHQRHILGKIVFLPTVLGLNLDVLAPVAFRIFAGNGTSEPDAWPQLGWMLVFDEMPSGSLILAARSRHELQRFALIGPARIEYSFADVRAR